MSQSQPTVVLRQGTYTGRHLEKTEDGLTPLPRPLDAFLGIPYAQASRFCKPITLPASEDTFSATEPGEVCPASVERDANLGLQESEDCLNLNVWTPTRGEEGQGKKLPVIIYVHGGAFNMGYGLDRNIANFVSYSAEGIVGVSFNYRLGALGFLPLEIDETEKGVEAEGCTLNLGLWDQRMAFEWVRDNIGSFGGDCEKVTLMGVSAGAHAVGHHILSYTPESTPFHRAILESGSPTSRSVLYASSDRHAGQLSSLLKHLDIPSSASPDDILQTLCKLPVNHLTCAASKVWTENDQAVTWPFQPVIDCPPSQHQVQLEESRLVGIIPRPPLSSWSAKNRLQIPIITGFCTNEGTIFVPHCQASSDFRSFFQTLIPALSDTDLEELDGLYALEEFSEEPPMRMLGCHWRRLEAAYAHYAYIAPVLQSAHFLSASRPVFVYQFAAKALPFGTANHTDETAVVAHDVGAEADATGKPLPGLERVSEQMHGLFSQFVSDDPEGLEDKWPRFVSPARGGEGCILVFGEGNDERMGKQGTGNEGIVMRVRKMSRREIERVTFWWKRVPLSQGFGTR